MTYNFLLKICFITDQCGSTSPLSRCPIILTLYHRLQTDHIFQDLGYDFLQKPRAPPTLNEYLSPKVDREKSHKNFYLGCLDFIAGYLHNLLVWSRVMDLVSSSLIQFLYSFSLCLVLLTFLLTPPLFA